MVKNGVMGFFSDHYDPVRQSLCNRQHIVEGPGYSHPKLEQKNLRRQDIESWITEADQEHQ
jgi:hypothetical protein